MRRVERERVVDARELRRLVGLEDLSLDRFRQQVVVDAEQHVAFGVAGCEDRSVHELSCIARRHDAQLDAAVSLERPDDPLAHVEGVVREERHGGGLGRLLGVTPCDVAVT